MIGTRVNLHARRILLCFSAALAALAVAACKGDESPRPTATAVAPTATATPAGPTATPTPDVAALTRDGGIAIIRLAYDRLLDEYITPLEPAPLLSGGWTALRLEAETQGRPAPAQPSFAGDRAAAFAAFQAAYVPFATSGGDSTKLRYAFIRGMTQPLKDCHTFFLNPVASDTLVGARAGRGTVGVGIELAGVPPLVTEVVGGGPADAAGVLVGDRVIAVDGTETSAMAAGPAFELINGDEGTQVRLRLRRAGAGAPLELTMARARVVPPIVEARMLPQGIGYARIRNFVQAGIVKELRAALEGFEAQRAPAWIIDLRGNPGGILDPEAISLFVREGVIVRARGRTGELRDDVATGEVLPALRPTVLLTNNRTGSIAEVFAATLQEYGLATVIGGTTNGCVGYTDVRDFGDGSSMAVTTHVNLGPVTNKVLNGVGVVPDIAVQRTESDIAAGRDPQLDAAIAFLAQR